MPALVDLDIIATMIKREGPRPGSAGSTITGAASWRRHSDANPP